MLLRIPCNRRSPPLPPGALGVSATAGVIRHATSMTPPQQHGCDIRNVRTKVLVSQLHKSGPTSARPAQRGSQTHQRRLRADDSMPQRRHSRASLHRACRRGRTPLQRLAGKPPPSETTTARGRATARWTPPGSPWFLSRRTACFPRGAPWRRTIPPASVTQYTPTQH